MKKIVIFSLISYFTIYFGNNLLNIEKLIVDNFINNLTTDQINDYLNFQKKWQWLTYAIIPLFLLIKTALITSVLYIGTFFYSKVKVTFKQLFNAVVKAEFVFLGIGVLKIVWFYFFQTNYKLTSNLLKL